MALASWSLKAKASGAAALLFALGLALAGGLSYLAMSSVTDDSHTERMSQAINEGLATLKDVRTRMGVYSDMLARHPDVIAAVKANDAGVLEQVLTREFKALHASDATVSTLEVTDARGVIIMRGHNPKVRGDDKSKLPQIKRALAGEAAGGLTVSPTSGEAAEDSVKPILLGGTVIGTLKVGSYFKASTAEEIKKKTHLEIVFVANEKMTESTFGAGADLSIPGEVLTAARSGAAAPLSVDVKGLPYTAKYVHLPSDNGDGLTIGFYAERAGVLAARREFMSSLALKCVLALLIILPAVVVLANLATRQMLRLAAAMRRVADGNLDEQVPYADRSDEIGVMAKTVEVFKSNSAGRLRLEAERREADAAMRRKAELHEHAAAGFEAKVGTIIGTVSAAATELETAASMLTRTAATTRDLSAKVAGASEDAATNVQSIASATDQLTGSVQEIAKRVEESSNIARQAVAQAARTDARIGELSQAASRIGDVVKLITAIAEQTNLLALNATIEAARAGDAGRGFAVVAQEVKALAAQTAKATDEIGTQIAEMQTATQDSVSAIKEIGSTITRIAEIAAAISSAVNAQGAATGAIAGNVQRAAHGTSQVATGIADVSNGAGETGLASGKVLTSAQSLSAEAGNLRAEIERFLSTVRAA